MTVPDSATPAAKKSFLARITAKQWVAIVLTALAVVFIVQNKAQVPVHLLWFTVRWPLWVVLAVTLAVGWVAGWLITRNHAKRR